MLSFRRVYAAYGKKQVLDQIDFELPPHTLTAVVGKNGSGKSTLFACAGRKIPYTGEITLSGGELAAMTPRERAQRMAILPQTLHPRYRSRSWRRSGGTPIWISAGG